VLVLLLDLAEGGLHVLVGLALHPAGVAGGWVAAATAALAPGAAARGGALARRPVVHQVLGGGLGPCLY